MQAYILRRLLISIPMLIAITMITYAFINVAPGDPITAMINPEDPLKGLGNIEFLRERMGLNKPVPVRYLIWLREVVTGNFGYSYANSLPVLEVIGRRIGPTLELTLAALILSTVVGILFGVIAALKQYSIFDYVLSVASLFGISIPTFFFALICLFLFASHWQIFPAGGMSGDDKGVEVADNLYHLFLPAVVLSLDLTAGLSRYVRTAMLEVLKSDYVTTARAKGLSEYLVIGRHAFRNALLPMITILTLRLPFLFGGALLVEYMFSWPGMGQLAIRATFERDYTILMGLTVIISALVLFANLVADVLYAYADPRVRTQ